MIRYSLACENDDEFEGWFSSSHDYDTQAEQGLVECPACGSRAVRKAPMAPAIARRKDGGVPPEVREAIAAEVRKQIAGKFDYVGDRFAKEARDMHGGDAPERPIWGEATLEEAKALVDDGVPVAPLPPALAPVPPRKLN